MELGEEYLQYIREVRNKVADWPVELQAALGGKRKTKMSEKRMKFVKLRGYEDMEIPSNLDDAIAYLQLAKEAAEKEKLQNITLEIEPYESWGSAGVEIYIEGRRLETDQEFANRMADEKRDADKSLAEKTKLGK